MAAKKKKLPRKRRRWGKAALAQRLIRLQIELTGKRWQSLAELAAAIDEPIWSVRRDMEALQEAGLPIECTPDPPGPGRAGRYRLQSDWKDRFPAT